MSILHEGARLVCMRLKSGKALALNGVDFFSSVKLDLLCTTLVSPRRSVYRLNRSTFMRSSSFVLVGSKKLYKGIYLALKIVPCLRSVTCDDERPLALARSSVRSVSILGQPDRVVRPEFFFSTVGGFYIRIFLLSGSALNICS